MASKAASTEAKSLIVAGLQAQFGANYLGNIDKKEYVKVHTKEGDITVALALTIPKVEVKAEEVPAPVADTPATKTPVEISTKEQEVLSALMAQLGF